VLLARGWGKGSWEGVGGERRTVFTRRLAMVLLWLRKGLIPSVALTPTHLIVVPAFLLANILGLSIGVTSLLDLRVRTGTFCLVNLLPLYIGGRTQFFLKALGVSQDEYYLLHRWIGRTLIAEAIIHTGTALKLSSRFEFSESRIGGILVYRSQVSQAAYADLNSQTFCSLTLIFLSSPSPIRAAFYEVFLKLHTLLALSALVGFWVHLRFLGWKSTQNIYLSLTLISWIAGLILRSFFVLYRNVRTDLASTAIIRRQDGATRVCLSLPRAWSMAPGQYIYIWLPSIKYFQSHPYYIAWWEVKDYGLEIELLIEQQKGFSKTLHKHPEGTSIKAAIEGPYGEDVSLGVYGVVLMLATGPQGVIRQLSHLRGLVDDAGDLSIRNIRVVWVLETGLTHNPVAISR